MSRYILSPTLPSYTLKTVRHRLLEVLSLHTSSVPTTSISSFIANPCIKPPSPLIALNTVRHRLVLGGTVSPFLHLGDLFNGVPLLHAPHVGLEPTTTSLKGWRSTN